MKKIALIAGYALFVGIFASGIYGAITGNQLVPGYDGAGVALFSGIILTLAVWRRFRNTGPTKGANGKVIDVLVLTMPARKRIAAAMLLVGLAVAFYLLMQSALDRKLWFFQAGFGLFAVLALMAVLAVGQRVALTLTPDGLDYTPFKVGPIAWRDIRGLRIKRVRYFDAIVLDIIAPERYRSRHILRRIFGAHFEIMPAIFEQDAEWLASEIKKRISAFGSRRGTSAKLGFQSDMSPEAP